MFCWCEGRKKKIKKKNKEKGRERRGKKGKDSNVLKEKRIVAEQSKELMDPERDRKRESRRSNGKAAKGMPQECRMQATNKVEMLC